MEETDRLACVVLLEDRPAPRPPEVQQEIDIALFDLSESNHFRLLPRSDGTEPPGGPYSLTIGMPDRKLVFDLTTGDGRPAASFHLSLSPFRTAITDYLAICAQYADAVKTLPPAKIEAIDMGRRGLHDAGADIVLERLEGKAETDRETARRLFTLIAALSQRG